MAGGQRPLQGRKPGDRRVGVDRPHAAYLRYTGRGQQVFTATLLFLAANTSFNAFPRLLAILAGDGHLPRQFALRGEAIRAMAATPMRTGSSNRAGNADTICSTAAAVETATLESR